jgi:AcrR family transcriptional regulator
MFRQHFSVNIFPLDAFHTSRYGSHPMPVFAPERPSHLAASAFELFARDGIKNVNLDRIASHAGVTKGSLYWHYDSKHDLLKAACQHYYRTYLATIRKTAAQTRDPRKRLARVLEMSVRTCLVDEKNRVFTMEVWTISAQDAVIRRGWQKFYDEVRQFYVGLVEEAGVDVADALRSVNLMLEVFEGIKLRAMFEPEICAPSEAGRMVAELKQILGMRTEDKR